MEPFGFDGGDLSPPASTPSRSLAERFASRASQPLTSQYTSRASMKPPSSPEELGRQLTRQLTQMMNSTEAAVYTDESPRGEQHTPLVYLLGSRLLRSGLMVQTLALAAHLAVYVMLGGGGWPPTNLFNTPEVIRKSQVYLQLSAFLEIMFLIGVVQVAAFQILIADSSKWTVGFRSGSKLLSVAVSLDLCAAALRVAMRFHYMHFVCARWLGRNLELRGEWCLLYLGDSLQGVALCLFGFAFAALETFHDKGTNERWAWGLLAGFTLAGVTKLICLFHPLTSLSPLLLLGALAAAQRWAEGFEPLLERWSPQMHSRRIEDCILPNPRPEGAPEGPPKPGEAYTYAAIPAAAAATGSSRDSKDTPLSTTRSLLGPLGSTRSIGGGGPLASFTSNAPNIPILE